MSQLIVGQGSFLAKCPRLYRCYNGVVAQELVLGQQASKH